MPMPKLLKCLSERSAIKRLRSVSEDPQTSSRTGLGTSNAKPNPSPLADAPTRVLSPLPAKDNKLVQLPTEPNLTSPEPGSSHSRPEPFNEDLNDTVKHTIVQNKRFQSIPTITVFPASPILSSSSTTITETTEVKLTSPESCSSSNKARSASALDEDFQSDSTIGSITVSPVSPIADALPLSSAPISGNDTIVSNKPASGDGTLLAETWLTVQKNLPATRESSTLQKTVTTIQQLESSYQPTVTAIETTVQSTITVQTLEQNVIRYLDKSAVLLKILDEIGTLHPFLKVLVLAFKGVWTLEMKHQSNDKKVRALYVEIKEMMTVLLQLQDVKDVDVKAPGGTTLEAKLQELAKTTAKDIQGCANVCDTYTKKRMVGKFKSLKVLMSVPWESRLLHYVDLFTKRKTEFQFALTIHTAGGVDSANQKIDDLQTINAAINQKMDVMMKLFERFVTPGERKMADIVTKKGGPAACQRDLNVLTELATFELNTVEPADSGQFGPQSGLRQKSDLDDLREELATSIDDSIRKNLTIFQRNLEIQHRRLKEELTLVISRENDRVINSTVSALTAGPYGKIRDKSMFSSYTLECFRIVERNEQVYDPDLELARQYQVETFCIVVERLFSRKMGLQGTPTNATVATISHDGALPKSTLQYQEDGWALVHLNVIRLQPVTEAFDDDGSGFITIAEVNAFTDACPLGWSLPHWIAYWASGWELTMMEYASKIRDVIGKMFSILPEIKMENQGSVNRYLRRIYGVVWLLQMGVNNGPMNYALQLRFATYVESEENRLREGLEEITYYIDAPYTLGLITGPGRLERFLLPVCYLLLKQHFEIFRVAQTRLLHHNELRDAVRTFHWVSGAVNNRVKTLQSSFQQQRQDISQQFRKFSHGLYQFWFDPRSTWGPSIKRAPNIPEHPYNSHLEENPPNAKVCKYALDKTDIDYTVYDDDTTLALQPNEKYPASLNIIFGTWNGYIFDKDAAMTGMITLIFRPKDSENNTDTFIVLVGSEKDGETSWSGVGCYRTADDPNLIGLTIIRESSTTIRIRNEKWEGRVDIERGTFTGQLRKMQALEEDPSQINSLNFFFSRISPDILCFRPLPIHLEVQENKSSLLWQFAINAVRNQVRRENWCWSYFAERRKIRKRFIELVVLSNTLGKLRNGTEIEDSQSLLLRLRTTDRQYYTSLAHHEIRITVDHGAICDNCQGSIGGSRVLCLVCQIKDSMNTIDFCDDFKCLSSKITRDNRNDLPRPHLPTHDLLKIRRVLHIRDMGYREERARKALTECRKYIDGRNWCQGIEDSECPTCILCKTEVTIPCWYCVQCEAHNFICDNCDKKGQEAWANKDIYDGPHVHHLHDLVRCKILVEDTEITVDSRLMSVEERMTKMESRLMSMEERMVKMEHLLERVLEHLVVTKP